MEQKSFWYFTSNNNFKLFHKTNEEKVLFSHVAGFYPRARARSHHFHGRSLILTPEEGEKEVGGVEKCQQWSCIMLGQVGLK